MSERPHGVPWAEARAMAAAQAAGPATVLALRDAVGAVADADVVAPRPVPHYDSSAMDGWAVAGPGPWRLTTASRLAPGEARVVVTGAALPAGTEAVVPVERGTAADGVVRGERDPRRSHVRLAGEESPAGAVLVGARTRLSPAHVAVLAIAGLDDVAVRPAPRIGFVLTGDEVVLHGAPPSGRVRDAFDPLLPLAAARLGGAPLPPARAGDDPVAIRTAIDGLADAAVVVTVGGTGRSGADRLREAIGGAETVFDGVAMRPGHPALLARLPDGRPLLALPGNPLAAVAVLLSFLPPVIDALTLATPAAPAARIATCALPGWAGGTSLVPCDATLRPAPATRPNMLRGLAASDVLAVVPPDGVAEGARVEVLPLPW
ncbi:molybdopterin molybdotransferase MoeA [Amnibacterium sp.]|uniref:molybdopterin molybdotransferase MoeA n=1 Tax=Amnibacterium sp. TaxID=1872496 RepID=UPI003F7B8255